TCNTAKAFPATPADHVRFLGSIGWCFANQVDFPLITNQAGLTNALSDILPLLNHQAANNSPTVKAFFSFSDAIIQIEDNHCEAQCQWELEAPFFIKNNVTTNYKTSSEATLVLLGQVNAVLETISLADGNVSVPHKDLKNQHEAIELAMQQQFHSLDLSLQMYKLITAHLACLDKVLASADIDLAGSLLNALNASFEAVPEESNAELANPPKGESEGPLALLSAAAM
ncbi:hypothetical protein C0989_006459, partial [Termitomyces sp. Mn162]